MYRASPPHSRRVGYREGMGHSQWNFELSDDRGRQVDVHSFVLGPDGNVEKGIMYPTGSLTGTGTISGHAVRCVSPEWMVKFHSGYELTAKDFTDVSALCEKFGIELPQEYVQFKTRVSPLRLPAALTQ
jgi:lincosamide nucleotidyltransferase A/C/D/E